MKSIRIISVFATTLLLLLGACKKTTTEGINAKIVEPHYPAVTLNGDQFISKSVGSGTYTDAGATALDDVTGKTVTLTPVKNDVNLTTPGFYTVGFAYRNDDGYEVTDTRFVLVTTVSDADDFSGVYKRTSNGINMNVTKVATGLYKTDNVGGSTTVVPAYFGLIDASTLIVPEQQTSVGGLSCINASLTVSPSDTTIKWSVKNGLFNPSPRTFSHQ